jgi:CheY-like chemotaxis protein
MLRLLIIDDSDTRIDTLKQWLPDDVHPVFATSAGLDVARRIALRITPDVPILVHSMSYQGGSAMQQILDGAGFAVARIRFEELTRERFLEWLEDVRAEWTCRAGN